VGIPVDPIYAYQDALTKAQIAVKARSRPELAVSLLTKVFSLIDDGVIVPFDTAATGYADHAWLQSSYSASRRKSEVDDHMTWRCRSRREPPIVRFVYNKC
jgi:hypothetical protein